MCITVSLCFPFHPLISYVLALRYVLLLLLTVQFKLILFLLFCILRAIVLIRIPL